VTRRYQTRPILLTTNKAFGEWNQIFPNAACVVALIDRLLHRAEIVALEGMSYRLKEAKERTERKAKARSSTARKQRWTPCCNLTTCLWCVCPSICPMRLL